MNHLYDLKDVENKRIPHLGEFPQAMDTVGLRVLELVFQNTNGHILVQTFNEFGTSTGKAFFCPFLADIGKNQ